MSKWWRKWGGGGGREGGGREGEGGGGAVGSLPGTFFPFLLSPVATIRLLLGPWLGSQAFENEAHSLLSTQGSEGRL
jgi:hypothetical protein